jgi:phosphoserine aminotransferase
MCQNNHCWLPFLRIKGLNLHLPTKMAHSSKSGIFLPQDLSKNQIRQSPHTVSLPYSGMRASIYNAMPQEGVDQLVAFMQDFERENG